MTGFPLRLVNHTDLLSLSLIWGQRGGEEEEKEEEHHKLHPLCQYLISVCDLSAFLEFVILQSCFMFLHKWENYNSHSVQNIPCIQQKPIRPPTKFGMLYFITVIFDHCLRWHGSALSMPFLFHLKSLSVWNKVGCGEDKTGGCSGILHCSESTGRWQVADKEEEKWRSYYQSIFISAGAIMLKTEKSGW